MTRVRIEPLAELGSPRVTDDLTLLVRPAEAAKMLAISPRSLWQLTNSREIRCVRIGRSVRYDVRDLENFIKSQKN